MLKGPDDTAAALVQCVCACSGACVYSQGECAEWHGGGGGEAVFTPDNLPRLWFKMIQIPCMWRDTAAHLPVQDWDRWGLPNWSPPKIYRLLQTLESIFFPLIHLIPEHFFPCFLFYWSGIQPACMRAVTLCAEQTRICVYGCFVLHRLRGPDFQVHHSGLLYWCCLPFTHLTSWQDFLVHGNDKRGTGENTETDRTEAETWGKEVTVTRLEQKNAANNLLTAGKWEVGFGFPWLWKYRPIHNPWTKTFKIIIDYKDSDCIESWFWFFFVVSSL